MIKRLYDKNELMFSLLSIGVYIVLFSLADRLSDILGMAKSITACIGVVAVLLLLLWISKHSLNEKYGLTVKKLNCKTYLYFLPLVLMVSLNLWCGVNLNVGVLESVFYVIAMMAVGIIEEVIFRGFLFKTLCRENVKTAFLVSSLTFGFGHIINLLNGAELLMTLLQVCYAAAAGFLFTVIFYKSGTLLPCIAAHSALNALSVFSNGESIISAAVLTAVPILYAVWIIKQSGRKNIKKERCR